jgi:hypothetical protein
MKGSNNKFNKKMNLNIAKIVMYTAKQWTSNRWTQNN